MELQEWKDLLRKRLHIEWRLFEDSILRQTKKEIYKSSYKIEVFANVYEILLEDMEGLQIRVQQSSLMKDTIEILGAVAEDTVRELLYQNFGILDFLYQEWLAREDCAFDELKTYIGRELEAIAMRSSLVCRKEDAGETEFNKAAEGKRN